MTRLQKFAARLVTAALVTAAGLGAVAAAENAGNPDLDEIRTIAEEGFIYGLPIVMNYAVMYEFAVDRNSSQFKAPFNHILNLARVAAYKDTAVVTPNSDTPYSFLWLDLRAEPMVISVPRWKGTATTWCNWWMAIPTTTAILAPAPRVPGPAVTWWWGPGWKAKNRRASTRCSSRRRPSALPLSAPSSTIPRIWTT